MIASFFAANLVHETTWAAGERESRKTGSVSSISTNVDDSSDSLKTVNFRVGPLHALLGIADVEVDFGVSDSFTLGPMFSYINRNLEFSDSTLGAYRVQAESFGLRGNWYFSGKRFSQGAYLAPFILYGHAKVSGSSGASSNLEGEGSGFGLGALIGYQWVWETFNINLGGGFQASQMNDLKVRDKRTGDEHKTETVSTTGALALEWTIGFMF